MTANQTNDRLARRIARIKEHTERVRYRPIFGGSQIVSRSTTPAQLIDDFDLLVGQRVGSAEIDDDLGIGWHIEADGTATFHDVTVRGDITAAPGANKLLNGDFHSDVGHWAAGTGSITLETDPAQISDGVGALKHTTPASAAETYVSGDNVAIERDVPVRLTAKVKPAASGDSHRLGLRWKDAAGTFISETTGTALTGVTGYQDIEAFGDPPLSTSASSSSSTFGPGSDWQTTNIFGSPNDGYGNYYKNIDETGLDANDWIAVVAADVDAYWKGWATIGTGSLTGKTPTSLSISIWSERGFANAYIDPFITIGTTHYRKGYYSVIATGAGDYQLNTATWATNPATGVAWTAADLEAFKSSGANHFGFFAIVDNAWSLLIDKMDFRVNWTTAGASAAPALVEPRLYTTPASGAGCITRWDVAELRPQPVTRGGALEVDRLEVSRIGCHLRRSSNQSIGAFATDDISWNTEDEDTSGFIAVTGTTVTIPTGLGGIYDCTFITKPQSGTTGGCVSFMSVNGAANEGTANTIQPERGIVSFAGRVLNAGDTLVFKQYNNAGGAINYLAELWLYRRDV